MPKKIENPIRDGMPSKIYLAAYPKAIGGYEMGQKMQRVKNPRTDHIYDILKQYKDLFERTEMKGKRGMAKPVLSKAKPLLREIEKALDKKAELSNPERKTILKILDSKEFRSLISDVIIDMDFKGDINAADKLMFWLYVGANFSFVPKKRIEKRSKPMKVSKVEGKCPPSLIDFVQLLLDTAPSSLLEKFLIAHSSGGHVIVSLSPETHPALRELISKK